MRLACRAVVTLTECAVVLVFSLLVANVSAVAQAIPAAPSPTGRGPADGATAGACATNWAVGQSRAVFTNRCSYWVYWDIDCANPARSCAFRYRIDLAPGETTGKYMPNRMLIVDGPHRSGAESPQLRGGI